MGKCLNAFFSETTNQTESKLDRNVHWMVLYKVQFFLFRYKMEDGGYSRTQFNIGPYGKNVSKCFFSETTRTIETKLPRNDHWKVLYKIFAFSADRKFKMAATAIHRLTLDPMGKCSNAFFSETTNMIRAKLYMNVHWMVLCKLQVFCSDMKFKNGGYSRTLDPM